MITVNGVEKTLEKPLSVIEYLETNKYVPVQVAIELKYLQENYMEQPF